MEGWEHFHLPRTQHDFQNCKNIAITVVTSARDNLFKYLMYNKLTSSAP